MGNTIEQIFLRFISNPDEHLSDERMADLFCEELSFAARWIARRHLAMCQDCGKRYEDLVGPRAEQALQLYRESLDNEEMRLQAQPRAVFAQWLQLQMRPEVQLGLKLRAKRRFSRPRFLAALPALSIGTAFGLVIGVSAVSYWSWKHMPNITANTLLIRAERWDTPSVAAHPGVARQTVQIKTSRQTIKRAVYWDLQGIRRPRGAALPAAEEQLRAALDKAGVNWDQPISASAYQTWHDHQHVRADRIIRSGAHLLTLTTTVPDGAVSQESLTVRDTDFHPVEQKVDFRNSETVEIAELDFAILPWNAVDANAFEPIANAPGPIGNPVAHVLPHLPVSDTPSPEQLDETELAARLILNQLHADTGEQIEIHRSQRAVEVDGLVETEERKRELIAGLMTVPRLKVSIQSATHLLENAPLANEVVTVQAASLPDQPSALDRYMRTHGSSTSEINALAERIFSSALAISQESNAIADLETRFLFKEHTPVIAKATLEDLLYSHRERLQEALRKERLLLVETGHMPASHEEAAQLAGSSLASETERNLALSKELTQTNIPVTRGAEAIVDEMFSTADQIVATLDASGKPKDDSVQNTGKE